MERYVVIVILALLAGCVRLTMSGGMNRSLIDTKSAERCQALEISGVKPVLQRTGNACELKLVADGRFSRQVDNIKTWDVKGRRHVLSIGLFPGGAQMAENDVTIIFIVPLSVIAANTFTLGYPTWNALFIEPFRDYHDATFLGGAEIWSVIGCRKYLASYESKKETEKESSHDYPRSVVLSGYAVLVNGVRYTPNNEGVVTIPNCTSGKRLVIEIRSPPKFSEGSDDSGSDLRGLILEARCP